MADLAAIIILAAVTIGCFALIVIFARREVRDLHPETIAEWVECPWHMQTAARERGVGMAAPSDGFNNHKTSSFLSASSDEGRING